MNLSKNKDVQNKLNIIPQLVYKFLMWNSNCKGWSNYFDSTPIFNGINLYSILERIGLSII